MERFFNKGGIRMALQIMKLAIQATSTVTINPIIERFFHTTIDSLTGPTTFSIDAGSFFTDTGAATTALPALTADNSYYRVFINGVLQMDDLLTYTAGVTGVGEVSINIPSGSTIPLGTPVVLEVVNFAPKAITTIST